MFVCFFKLNIKVINSFFLLHTVAVRRFSYCHHEHECHGILGLFMFLFWRFLSQGEFIGRIGWFPGTDPAFKHSPQSINRVEVRALRKPSQKLNVSLI